MDKFGMCRICRGRVRWEDEAYNLLKIPRAALMYTACTNLLVHPGEEYMMPSVVCCVCFEELEKCYAFRTACIESDTRWRTIKVEVDVDVDVGVDIQDMFNEDMAIQELEQMLARKSPIRRIERIQLKPDSPIDLIQFCPVPQMESLQLSPKNSYLSKLVEFGNHSTGEKRPRNTKKIAVEENKHPRLVHPIASIHQSPVLIESTQIIPVSPTEPTPSISPVLELLERTATEKSHQSSRTNKEQNAKNPDPPKIGDSRNHFTGEKSPQSMEKIAVEESKDPISVQSIASIHQSPVLIESTQIVPVPPTEPTPSMSPVLDLLERTDTEKRHQSSRTNKEQNARNPDPPKLEDSCNHSIGEKRAQSTEKIEENKDTISVQTVLIASTQIIPVPPTEPIPSISPVQAKESTQLAPCTDTKKIHQCSWKNKEQNAKKRDTLKLPTRFREFLNRSTGKKRLQSKKKKTVEKEKNLSPVHPIASIHQSPVLIESTQIVPVSPTEPSPSISSVLALLERTDTEKSHQMNKKNENEKNPDPPKLGDSRNQSTGEKPPRNTKKIAVEESKDTIPVQSIASTNQSPVLIESIQIIPALPTEPTPSISPILELLDRIDTEKSHQSVLKNKEQIAMNTNHTKLREFRYYSTAQRPPQSTENIAEEENKDQRTKSLVQPIASIQSPVLVESTQISPVPHYEPTPSISPVLELLDRIDTEKNYRSSWKNKEQNEKNPDPPKLVPFGNHSTVEKHTQSTEKIAVEENNDPSPAQPIVSIQCPAQSPVFIESIQMMPVPPTESTPWISHVLELLESTDVEKSHQSSLKNMEQNVKNPGPPKLVAFGNHSTVEKHTQSTEKIAVEENNDPSPVQPIVSMYQSPVLIESVQMIPVAPTDSTPWISHVLELLERTDVEKSHQSSLQNREQNEKSPDLPKKLVAFGNHSICENRSQSTKKKAVEENKDPSTVQPIASMYQSPILIESIQMIPVPLTESTPSISPILELLDRIDADKSHQNSLKIKEQNEKSPDPPKLVAFGNYSTGENRPQSTGMIAVEENKDPSPVQHIVSKHQSSVLIESIQIIPAPPTESAACISPILELLDRIDADKSHQSSLQNKEQNEKDPDPPELREFLDRSTGEKRPQSNENITVEENKEPNGNHSPKDVERAPTDQEETLEETKQPNSNPSPKDPGKASSDQDFLGRDKVINECTNVETNIPISLKKLFLKRYLNEENLEAEKVPLKLRILESPDPGEASQSSEKKSRHTDEERKKEKKDKEKNKEKKKEKKERRREKKKEKTRNKLEPEAEEINQKEESHAPEIIEESSNQEDLPRSFTCKICSKKFASKKRYQNHKKQHGEHLLLPCLETGCEEKFKKLEQLTEHMKTHTVNCFPCEQRGCDKKYRHKGTLVTHQRKVHGIGAISESYVCDVCGKPFYSVATLTHHELKHRDRIQLPFACEEPGCTLRFRKRRCLKDHTMQHKGIKNYTCPHCGRKQMTVDELKDHMNHHALELTCPVCSKVCDNATDLEAHIRDLHESIRKYPCGVCKKTFERSQTRRDHEMTHTGERNYKCKDCGKGFTQPSTLRAHRKIHQRSKPRPPTPERVEDF